MNKLVILFLFSILLSAQSISSKWENDILDGYEMRHVQHPNDYSGKVQSTIIRKKTANKAKTGILYIHGYNDYFFQKEMGDKFSECGYGFYAVDLRKYGRSIIAGQHKFQARDIHEYYADIDSAITTMKHDGIKSVIIMGHSTGGLIASLYMSERPDKNIKALILNSPFLDWNLGKLECVIPLVSFCGKIFPSITIPQNATTAYAESLLKQYNGEWEYNTEWKLMRSPDVEAGWINAVNNAQNILQKGSANISVPILLMYSSQSVSGDKWTPEFNNADAVLDVKEIAIYGKMLGKDIKCLKVIGGLHDLMLSNNRLRNNLYIHIFNWLDSLNLQH